MKTNCTICHKPFEQQEALFLICILCHLLLLLKAFPEKEGPARSANCFIRAYDEHQRLKVKGATA